MILDKNLIHSQKFEGLGVTAPAEQVFGAFMQSDTCGLLPMLHIGLQLKPVDHAATPQSIMSSWSPINAPDVSWAAKVRTRFHHSELYISAHTHTHTQIEP